MSRLSFSAFHFTKDIDNIKQQEQGKAVAEQ
jgi:hypothetical protein